MPARTPSSHTGDDLWTILGIIGLIAGIAAFVLTCIAAWVTHVVVRIKTASWILLLFGCVVAPIGVIHGIGVWLGAF